MLLQLKQRISQPIRQYFQLKDIKNAYFLLKPFLFRQWKTYFVLLLLLAVDISFTIAYAWFFGRMTDAAVQGNWGRIKQLIPLGVLLTMVRIISNYYQITFSTRASNGLKNQLKEYLFEHILRLPAGEVSKLRSGDVISYFNNDIHSVDGVIGKSLINLVRLPFVYLAVLIYLLQINWVLCLMSVFLAPIAMFGGAFFGLLLKKNGRRLHQLVADLNSTLSETFQGLQVIRSFTLEKVIFQNFKRKNKKYYSLELENARLQGWYYSGGYFVNSVALLLNLSLGAYLVSTKTLTVGSLLTFINLVGHLVYPMTGLAGQWAGFQRSVTAIERLVDLVNKPTASTELSAFIPTITNVKSIEFKDISFSYDDSKKIFADFSFKIPAGKMVAIVGPSGAGKTTLFNLLQGFYLPQKGNVLIDGIPIEQLSLSELRSSIAHVPQETFLFTGTIRENLLMARPNISDLKMVEAAQKANIHDFIVSLPNGYDTEVGERGVKLSGGQRQRVAIARAILKDAPILLLDEATSALDSETENHIKEELEHVMKNKTTLIIAHRLSTIQNADMIIVIHNGKLEQIGKHEDLIQQNGLYHKLYSTGMTKEKVLV